MDRIDSSDLKGLPRRHVDNSSPSGKKNRISSPRIGGRRGNLDGAGGWA
jgi:hypothetical protein